MMGFKKSQQYSGMLLALLSIIVFEAFQQNYYITTYDLVDSGEIEFIDLFISHMWRWLVWCATAVIFYYLVRQAAIKDVIKIKLFYFMFLIFGLVVTDVVLIAIISIYRQSESLSGSIFLGYFEFFIYQKGPIFFIAYICLGIYAYLQSQYNVLSIKLESLLSAKASDNESYTALHNKNWNDQTKVLNVRIGRKVKLIPIEDINWIESDNYCVRIHTRHSEKYTLRSSMKKLEEILPNPAFIRTHRTSIVNTSCIDELVTGNRPYLILKDSTKIEIASSRLSYIKEFMKTNILTNAFQPT